MKGQQGLRSGILTGIHAIVSLWGGCYLHLHYIMYTHVSATLLHILDAVGDIQGTLKTNNLVKVSITGSWVTPYELALSLAVCYFHCACLCMSLHTGSSVYVYKFDCSADISIALS